MKSLLSFYILVTLFISSFLPASAQNTIVLVAKNGSEQHAVPLKFIEGIEINRAILSYPPPVSGANTVKITVGFSGAGSIEQSLSVQFKYAQLLNRNVESIANLALFNFIEEWWDTRYHYGGHTKAGIDCSAFSALLLNKVFSIQVPRTAKEQYLACQKRDRENLMEGDLVFFNTRGGISHVGIYLGEGYFVHASTANGVTINNLGDDYYSARFLGGGRIASIAETGPVKAGVTN